MEERQEFFPLEKSIMAIPGEENRERGVWWDVCM
jgi:hypothetical protein